MQVSHSIPEGTQSPSHCLCTLGTGWAAVCRNSVQAAGLNQRQGKCAADAHRGTHTSGTMPLTQNAGWHSIPNLAPLIWAHKTLPDSTGCCMGLAWEVSVNTHCCRDMKYRLWPIGDAARDCAGIKKHSQVYSLHCPWKPLECMWKGGQSWTKPAQDSVLWIALDSQTEAAL